MVTANTAEPPPVATDENPPAARQKPDPEQLRTCNDELRRRYLELKALHFELGSLNADFKTWLEEQPRNLRYLEEKKEINKQINACELSMDQLAALGEQYELDLDL